METWLRNSWFFQQNMFRNFKDRYWEGLEEDTIRDKIKYALFICYGEHQIETNEYKDLPEKLTQKIVNHSASEKKKLFSCTFINVRLKDNNKESIECIFWTKNTFTGIQICIDTNCREYSNWGNFTEHNVLPESYLIFPRAGRYTDEIGSDINYNELICVESVACSLKAKIKKYVVGGAAVGVIAMLGVLPSDSILIPVILGAVTTHNIINGVSTGFTGERLVDNSEHEELGLDYQSIFTVSDIGIPALGVAALETTGCKEKSENFLCNSAIVLKLGSSTVNVCKAMTALSGINVFINVILEYKEKGDFNMKSLKLLKLTINFIFCINASLPLVQKLVEHMSRQSLDNVVSSLSQQASHTFSYVKRGYSISDDFNFLIQLLFPSAMPIMKRITDSPIVKFVCKVIKDTKLQGTTDLLILMTHLPEVLIEIDRYFLQSKLQMISKFGADTWKIIEKLNANDEIHFGNKLSSYVDKINFPVFLTNKINETLMCLYVIKNKDCLKEKSYLLLNAVMKFILRYDLKTYNYAVGKVNYYCDTFSEIYTKFMDNIYCDHFVNAHKNISVDSKNPVVTDELEDEKIIEYVFNETLELLFKSSNHLHDNYELHFQNNSYVVSSEETEAVFKFKVPKSDLNEKLCYDIANKHLPSLSLKLTKDHTIYESHFDQLAIISSNDDKFKLIFYVTENGENLDGLLMYVS